MLHARTSPVLAAVVSSCLLSLPAPAPAAPAQLSAFAPLDLDRGATGLGLALRRVGTTARVLYVTAHPDDEHNGVLVRLSRGLGVRTALLTVTRGEGGQNAIGPELFDALGVLRTGELMALHRYDAVEQYFGRAYEFGFSFSVEETFEKWGREDTLADVVRAVRAFRPDVMLTLPLTGEGGGQHHQAAARLARDAFRAAADPARFPGQGLAAWQASKIYEGVGVGGESERRNVGGLVRAEGAAVHVPTGVYDPLLGTTWQQLGLRSRSMHRCQGAGQLSGEPGPAEGLFRLIDAEPAVTAAESDILDGIDATVAGLARLAPGNAALASALALLDQQAAAARAAFNATAPGKAAPSLALVLDGVRELRGRLAATVGDPRGRAELDSRLADEEADVEAALALANGVTLEARADDGLVTPGQALGVELALFASAPGTLVEALELVVPAGWSVEPRAEASRPENDRGASARPGARRAPDGALRRSRYTLTAPRGARPSQPYWRRTPSRDRHELLVPEDESLPWSPPPAVARARVRAGSVAWTVLAPVVWRYAGPFVGGERRHELTVVPELSVRLTPEVTVVPLTGSRRPLEIQASVRSFARDAGPAELRLELPEGFRAEPASTRLSFTVEGEEAVARFRVTPPAAPVAGTLSLRALATRDGREHGQYVQVVEYDHVERRQLLRPAETRVVALDVRTAPGASVGYVMGSGDALDEAIQQLGVPLTLLTADDLLFADLSRFTTVVAGIRAYETRPDLRAAHGRLMRWVEAGGHLVVQYNRAAYNRLAPDAPPLPEGAPSPWVPYPAVVTSERISDETAPMRLLSPEHPLLATPNRIGESDWSGWVQERAIQLFESRDARYQELLAATDPFPYNPGEKRGLLVEAKVGRGTWTYVGLVLFREVPAGVPGAWRLLANLVSRP